MVVSDASPPVVRFQKGTVNTPNETTPLFKSDGANSPHRMCAAQKPLAFRLRLLILLGLVPFGGHFVKNSMSSLEVFFVEDPVFHSSYLQFGALVSAVALPSVIIPCFGGMLLDSKGKPVTVLIFLVIELLGQIAFVISVANGSFTCAMASRILFGIGNSNIMVIQRWLVAHAFSGSQISFAFGILGSFSNLANLIAKATVAVVAEYTGNYIFSLWYCTFFCCLSIIAGGVLYRTMRAMDLEGEKLERLQQQLHEEQLYNQRQKAKREGGYTGGGGGLGSVEGGGLGSVEEGSTKYFGGMFLLLGVLHTGWTQVYHLFFTFSSKYISERWGENVVNAGLMSSLVHVFTVLLSPAVGLLVDRCGNRLKLVMVAGSLTVLAYYLLIYTWVSPIVCLLLLSLAVAFVPAVLLSATHLTIPPTYFGVAFGMVEVLDSGGSFFGNLALGYLRDKSDDYRGCMEVILLLAVVALVLTLVLSGLDRRYLGGAIDAPTDRSHTTLVRGGGASAQQQEGVEEEKMPLFVDKV